MTTMTPQEETDVLVIGAGPMGATTALALARMGVKVQMVNRFNWTATTPRAHITNQRAVEVMRDLGVQEEAQRKATPWEWMGDTLFTTSLAGPEIARLRTWGTGDKRLGDYLQGSPCPMMDIPQDKLEPILVQHAAAQGAVLSFNTQYLSHTQDADGVTATLRDVNTGREHQVRAKYLVGADGARSKVLDDAGLPVEGQLARAATAYVLFKADLTRYVSHRPSILYWIVTSNAAFGEIGLGLLRAIDPWKRWIAGWGFDMSRGEPDFSHEQVRHKIRLLVGDPQLEIEVESTSVWYVNQAHAPEYAKGRVFCGGDAVHRHPPSSGLGSNTCMQDAFNLAWKLAYVIKGYAGPALLSSYSLERSPVGAQVVKRANQSRVDYGPLNACFRDKQAADPVAAGLAQLADPGAEGVARREALAQALQLKNHEFNAQGVEMNQRCVSAAVIPDTSVGEEVWQRDPELYLQATTRPGAKIPHAWLIDAQGHRISTLDRVGKGRTTLVTGIAGQAWVEAVKQLNMPYLDALVIGATGAQDVYSDWRAVREIDEAGALLVRPDGVVAWRSMRGVKDVDTARKQLAEVIGSVMALP